MRRGSAERSLARRGTAPASGAGSLLVLVVGGGGGTQDVRLTLTGAADTCSAWVVDGTHLRDLYGGGCNLQKSAYARAVPADHRV